MANASKKIIYCIDDGQIARMLYRVTFDGKYIVGTFPSGTDAIQAMASEKPDLIICDLCMPWQNGYDVSELIRTDLPDVPIIIATAMDGGEQNIACCALGYGFWQKDSDIKDLKELVEWLLSLKQK